VNKNQVLSFQLLFVDVLEIDSFNKQDGELCSLNGADPGQPSLPIPGLG